MIAGLAFDTETGGVDTENDRIVTAYLAEVDALGNVIREQEWIIDSGVPVPEEAAAIHGWTNERIAAHPKTRRDVSVAIHEITEIIRYSCLIRGLPLMGMNLAFDLSLLDAEHRRHSLPRLEFGDEANPPLHVLDALILDRHFDPWRKGTGMRKLIRLAEIYRIPFTEEEAHSASFDARTAARVIQRILARHKPDIAAQGVAGLSALHRQQVAWRAEQQRSLEKWLRANRDPQAVCDPGWPLYTTVPEGTRA